MFLPAAALVTLNSVTLDNCSLEWCQMGVYASYCNVTYQNSTKCSLDTDHAGFACFSGALTDLCAGDSDGNGFPDAWEYKYFGHTGVPPNDDADGDCASNLEEYNNGSNPVGSFPSFTATPVYQVVQAGGTATFSCAATPACVIYEWRLGIDPTVRATGPTLTIPNAQFSDAGEWTVTARGAFTDPYTGRLRYLGDGQSPVGCAQRDGLGGLAELH